MTVAEVVTRNGRSRYVVVDNHGELVEPAARYLKYLDLCGKARNTLRTYARSLAFYFTFLRQKGLAFERVQIADLAGFVHWLKRTVDRGELVNDAGIKRPASERAIDVS